MDKLNGIPGIEIRTYGEGDRKFESLEGTIPLEVWAEFQNTKNADGPAGVKKLPGHMFHLDVGGDMVVDVLEITNEHVNAYRYAVDNQAAIKNTILQSLFNRYQNLRDEYGYSEEEAKELMPDIDDKNEFRSLIRLSSVHLLNVHKEGMAYVGYGFDCSWDEEHGFGVMMHKDRIVEMGGADASFLTWIARADMGK